MHTLAILVLLLLEITLPGLAGAQVIAFEGSLANDPNGTGVQGLAGGFDAAVSPDGQNVYTAAFGGDQVGVFSRDPATGSLGFLEVHSDGAPPLDGLLGAFAVEVSPDGKNVYVSGQADDAVTAFSRDALSGLLTPIQTLHNTDPGIDGIGAPEGMAVSPDGGQLYVTSSSQQSVTVFTRDPGTGLLSFLERQSSDPNAPANPNKPQPVGLLGADVVTVSSDGLFVYVGAAAGSLPAGGSVAAFHRDPTTGSLSFFGLASDGVGGVTGLVGVRSLQISPDGLSFYATGPGSSGIDPLGGMAVFDRDPTTGGLGFREKILQGQIQMGVTVVGMGQPYEVAVSPDGTQIFVAALLTDSIALFDRNRSPDPNDPNQYFGQPLFSEVLANGFGGVTGIDAATSVALDPTGSHAYVTGAFSNAIATFSIDSDQDSVKNAADNCRYVANVAQADSGGLSTSLADGIGDVCQCGDVNDDGLVNNTDSIILSRFIGGLPPGVNAAKCSITGGTECNNTDSIVLKRSIGGLPPGIAQVCTAAVP